ncbi:arginine--tRNA ligase [Ketobacter alkanivorans]|uniref:Arginine--tRNA ligase n=1 Tax=Ketobacter alkanivorans TaxID=1917421 RepID=A0A2K9LJ06_9GAMM|nr:arginine--tRNA ligase [Ketobacter alkanivorans]AUM12230.1 arginine--tRNA ligase [Ketobacter alkanivorans]MCP5014797.1 arginine--tRNA ligase [Ketobacter sp.]
MKEALQALLETTFDTLIAQGVIPADAPRRIQVDRTKDKSHGDFATNLAMTLAKAAGKKPRELAQLIVDHLPENDAITQVDIAGPGFINFFMNDSARFAVVEQALTNTQAFCSPDVGKGEKVLLEYVSANPTGPMHVGHGRGAAYGSALGNLLKATGYAVHREYYINDAGRQADVLAVSVYLRYLEACGETVAIPSRAYPGAYVQECGTALFNAVGKQYFHPYATVIAGLPQDPEGEGDEIKTAKEKHLDALIEKVRNLLGEGYRSVQDFGLNTQLDSIRATLKSFNVEFDQWFSERSLEQSGAIEKAIDRLRERGHVYEQGGAIWLRTSELGDEKDRVLIRDNGLHTYFAADVAYHLDKLDRGFENLIDVWGADHHGYIARVRAAIEALTGKGDLFHVALIQFVTLSSGRMGKRSGNFVTLSQLIEEAGNDATRFFYLTRSPEQHLEFDIDLARSQTSDNPVFYLQYAHARVCSMMRELQERKLSYDESAGLAALPQLPEPNIEDLAKRLAAWPEALANAARNKAPHQLTYSLRDLAQDFHTWYNSNKVLVEDDNLRNGRMAMAIAVKNVIANGLELLGVSAPEKM